MPPETQTRTLAPSAHQDINMGSVAPITKKTVDSAIETAGLKFSSGTTISFPGDSSFDEATQRWNAYKAPSYSASVTVGNEQDVTAAVWTSHCHAEDSVFADTS